MLEEPPPRRRRSDTSPGHCSLLPSWNSPGGQPDTAADLRGADVTTSIKICPTATMGALKTPSDNGRINARSDSKRKGFASTLGTCEASQGPAMMPRMPLASVLPTAHGKGRKNPCGSGNTSRGTTTSTGCKTQPQALHSFCASRSVWRNRRRKTEERPWCGKSWSAGQGHGQPRRPLALLLRLCESTHNLFGVRNGSFKSHKAHEVSPPGHNVSAAVSNKVQTMSTRQGLKLFFKTLTSRHATAFPAVKQDTCDCPSCRRTFPLLAGESVVPLRT